MSSTQVPLWVPVIVALFGFVGVLGAQLVAVWREDRRWWREQEREELRWQRERTREVENRDYEGRQQAYAQIVAAAEAFDWLVRPAMVMVRGGGVLTEEQVADLRRARDELRHSLGPINLHAPQRFNELLRDTMLPRSRLAMSLVDGEHEAETIEKLWRQGQVGYRRMRVEMRKDLGLDAEALPDDFE